MASKWYRDGDTAFPIALDATSVHKVRQQHLANPYRYDARGSWYIRTSAIAMCFYETLSHAQVDLRQGCRRVFC
jgi:hypothetical protein